MKIFIKRAVPAMLLVLSAVSAVRAEVTITGTEVFDSAGAARERFSSTEKIGLKIDIYNSSPVSGIDYRFEIFGPGGNNLFTHTGNSSPGNIGTGGSSVSNIPLTFYDGPGQYIFKAKVLVDGQVIDSKDKPFSIYSPVINLTYPNYGARDLIDRPLVLRWVSSGATRYRIEVSEAAGFYRPVWSLDTTLTSAAYPENPSDIGQKLKGDQIYYWRVIGYDSSGRQIARSEISDFSVMAEAETAYSRDLGVKDILFSNTTLFPGDVKVGVIVGNAGSQAESNIGIELFLDGRSAGKETIVHILPGAEVKVLFTLGEFLNQTARLSAVIDFADDDPRNNILSRDVAIPLPEEYRGVPKITGRVVDAATLDNLRDVTIGYGGPESGEIYTDRNGQFTIEKLPTGKYTLNFIAAGYGSPSPVSLDVSESKMYRIENVMLQKREETAETDEIVSAEYSLQEIWEIISRNISEERLREFGPYSLNGVEVQPEADINVIIQRINEGKTNIKNIGVEIR